MKKLLTGIILGVVVLSLIYFLYPRSKPSIPKGSSLAMVVSQALSGSKGTYGIVIKNLKTGESYQALADREFEAGSLYKLWLMDTAFKKIESGELDENEILSGDVSDLNEKYGVSDLPDGVITVSVKDAITQMITISHNYSALLLAEKVGFSGREKVTPAQVAQFFEKQVTPKMLELLKEQTLNDKIPKYLPPNVPVAHKTGEIDNFSHDAGIVFGPSGDYILVVLSESDSAYGAEERISQISEAVYQYFN